MEKLDLKKQYALYYRASAKRIDVVDIPRLQFAMIEGEIPPEEKPGTSAAFAEDVGALYSAVYTLKFMIKKREQEPVDYPVMPLVAAGPVCEKICRPFHVTPPIFPRRVDWYRQNRAFKIDKARRELGYVPRVGLDEGLRRTAEWYRAEGLLPHEQH